MTREAFGIDIGGTGVKGAPVDLETGKLLQERLKIDTPQPSTPDAVSDVVAQLVRHFNWTGPVGATFPGVVKDGVVQTAANVDKKWIGTDAAKLFSEKLGGQPVTVMNDADAAGLAEAKWGAAKHVTGVTLLLTLGTGIGSAFLLNETLVPNTEIGHLEVEGHEAEKFASELVREKKDLSWKQWAKRLSSVLQTYEALFWPDLFVLGGGVSREPNKFIPLLKCRTPVVPAALANDAGLLGAALYDDQVRSGTATGANADPTIPHKSAPRRTAAARTPATPRKAPVRRAAATKAAPAKAAALPPAVPDPEAPTPSTPRKRAPRRVVVE